MRHMATYVWIDAQSVCNRQGINAVMLDASHTSTTIPQSIMPLLALHDVDLVSERD